ncbi:MAG: queuosine precursor transporter [Alphaproteobacteria bacterium]|nr:queuosine precursor transporter [Alphaproteobacteria bacterium]
MENEYIYLLLVALGLFGTMGAYKLGQACLVAYVGLINILCMVIGGHLTSVFGFTVSPATALYASVFLATDCLAERYGVSSARRAVWVTISSFIIFVIFTKITLLLNVNTGSEQVNESIAVLSDLGVRFMIAAVCAALVSQNFDIWFFDFINKRTNGRMLWLRNNGSTFVSQFLDSMIFWSIAFYGTGAPWLELGLTAWGLKVIIAAMDTPFMYLSKVITPLDLKSKK